MKQHVILAFPIVAHLLASSVFCVAMVRAYAIGQGASTQTFLSIGWIGVVGTETSGPLRNGLMVFAWVPNGLVAEFVIGEFLMLE